MRWHVELYKADTKEPTGKWRVRMIDASGRRIEGKRKLDSMPEAMSYALEIKEKMDEMRKKKGEEK